MPFHRLDQPRLFAADVGAGAAVDGDVEVEAAAEDVLAEEALGARFLDRLRQHRGAVVELAADVDVAIGLEPMA